MTPDVSVAVKRALQSALDGLITHGRRLAGRKRPDRAASRSAASICERNVPCPRASETSTSGVGLVLFFAGLLGLVIGPL